MVEAMESIKTAAIHADARAELANLLEKAAEELAVGAIKVAPTGLVIWCCLLGGGWNHGILKLSIGNIIIPSDFHSYFSEGSVPPTSYGMDPIGGFIENRQERCATGYPRVFCYPIGLWVFPKKITKQ